MSQAIKVCTICKEQKQLDFFNKKSSKKDGRQNICRECSSKCAKKHYLENKEYHSKKNKLWNLLHKSELQETLNKFIADCLSGGCIDCGEKDILVLEFDHVVGNKSMNISEMRSGLYSLKKIAEEITKCEVRCANCHRRKTAKTFTYWKVKFNI